VTNPDVDAAVTHPDDVRPAAAPAAAIAGRAPAVPEAVDDAFYALIASDPDLLRAEFDELIDNAWGPPPDPPAEDRPPTHPPRYRPPRFPRGSFIRGRDPDGVRTAQERSPPHPPSR